MKGRGIMAAAQKKPAGTAKMTAPRTSTAAKKTQSAAAGIAEFHKCRRCIAEYKESIVIKASRSKVIANNDGNKDK